MNYSESYCSLISSDNKKQIIKKGCDYKNKDKINWRTLNCYGEMKGYFENNDNKNYIDIPPNGSFNISGIDIQYVNLK
jgi:hypothetical protein